MAKKVLKTDLSLDGIEALKRQLLQYKDDLPKKCQKLVSSLLQSGIEVASTSISESPLGKYVTVSTNISSEQMGCNGILLAKGAVKEHEDYEPFSILLAIEFGAGIYKNPKANPLTTEMGYGVGTFPGQTHAFQNVWYYWDENSREWKPTSGIKATMPMYNASEDIRNKVIKTAKEIFGE